MADVPDEWVDGPDDAAWTLLLAHGAGAPADSPLLESLASRLAGAGIRVVRFEFPYMAARRSGGARRAPDRAAVLLETWRAMAERWRGNSRRLAIGGHSMGGRYATMLAVEPVADAVIAIGYPFRPAGKEPRVRHLGDVTAPLLIVQGTRDPFGGRGEIEQWGIPDAVRVVWMEDGDHSLTPRRRSGRSREENLDDAARAIGSFLLEAGE